MHVDEIVSLQREPYTKVSCYFMNLSLKGGARNGNIESWKKVLQGHFPSLEWEVSVEAPKKRLTRDTLPLSLFNKARNADLCVSTSKRVIQGLRD